MNNKPPVDYIEENLKRKKAVEAEQKFLKEEVLGHGVDDTASYQNIQGDMEKAIEKADE